MFENSRSYRGVSLHLIAIPLLGLLLSPLPSIGDVESIRAATPQTLLHRPNPVAPSPEALTRASDVYDSNCTICHGATGDGRGPASRSLRPRPMAFSDAELMATVSDGELFFAILRGSHGTTMPAFGDRFEEMEIWEIVAYLRELSFESKKQGR